MYSSINLTLYTQDDCGYCHLLKKKLAEWDFRYREINVSYDLFAKDFMREQGHRTVPQLYWNNTHLNKLPTTDLTKEHIVNELEYDNYIGGVEDWGNQKRA
jgi:glutaredoxin